MTINDFVQTFASVATAVGVFLAWWQVRSGKEQAISSFEDDLTQQYREIAAALPVEALLAETLGEEQQKAELGHFYRYIDFTNEQVFLRQTGRVRAETWLNWVDGIRSHLARPAFASAWGEIRRRAPGSFSELRRLEGEKFGVDPKTWRTDGLTRRWSRLRPIA